MCIVMLKLDCVYSSYVRMTQTINDECFVLCDYFINQTLFGYHEFENWFNHQVIVFDGWLE